MPNRSGAARAVCTPSATQHREPTDDGDRADEPEFVGDHREDEVAVGVGQVAELRVAPADPRAGQAAGRHAQETLLGLVGEVVLFLGDVHERREPVEAPGLDTTNSNAGADGGDGHSRQRRSAARRRSRRRRTRWRRARSPTPRSPCSRHRSGADRQRSAPSGTSVRCDLEHVASAGEQIGGERSTTASLRNSDGWTPNGADPDPRVGAVDAGADAGNERQRHAAATASTATARPALASVGRGS